MKTNSDFILRTKNWKSVSLANTTKIANACTSGVDFSRSSKKYIYISFLKNHYSGDISRFSKLMDMAAKFTKEYNQKLNTKISNAISDTKKQVLICDDCADTFTGLVHENKCPDCLEHELYEES